MNIVRYFQLQGDGNSLCEIVGVCSVRYLRENDRQWHWILCTVSDISHLFYQFIYFRTRHYKHLKMPSSLTLKFHIVAAKIEASKFMEAWRYMHYLQLHQPVS